MAVRNAIEIRGLTKRYGSLTAIENITFEVRRGELFGFLYIARQYRIHLLSPLHHRDSVTLQADGKAWSCRGVFRFIPICRSRKILNFSQLYSG